LDLWLYVCERIAGPEAARRIQQQMVYPYCEIKGE
jgi:hypothetical protein